MLGKRHALLFSLAIAPLIAGPAFAEVITYSIDLTSTANPSATGTLEATFDTDTSVLAWSVTYSGLTGSAGATHFHGPAAVGENAGVLVGIDGDIASPFSGEATLTAEVAANLLDGLLYLNFHTAANPGGELRGQVAPAM